MYTTFDNGASWLTGDISRKSPQVTGSDPVTAFDRRNGTAIHSSLNYSFQNSTGETCRGDLVVSVSTDGGVVWQPPTVVASGLGCDLSNVQYFNDKEWIVTDNNPSSPFYGRTYLTWTRFDAASGVSTRSAIFESHSDDGGKLCVLRLDATAIAELASTLDETPGTYVLSTLTAIRFVVAAESATG